MPVDSTHPEYDAASPKWRRMRDVIAGQDAVHAAGESYLPRLTNQTDADYKAYRMRTPWFGATARTVDALHGLMFRKPPTIEAPAGLAPVLEDVTLTDKSAVEFASDMARETLEVGRVGVLVDFPQPTGEPLTNGAAEALGIRPFATLYKAESVINWRAQRIANRMMLSLVVLSESEEAPSDGFKVSASPMLRVLKLEDGIYTQEIWRRTGDLEKWALSEVITPTRAGAPLSFIPFVFLGPKHTSAGVSLPPLLDMADLNLSHYRTTADLEHGAHFTGLPTPFFAGVQLEPGETIRIGSTSAIVSPHPEARAAYLEFSGQGLGALERLIDRKEAQMAALGASMLSPQKKAVEAAQTHEMRIGRETASLADIASSVGRAMTQVLQWIADWAGIKGEVRCTLTTDYVAASISAQDLTALLSAWQSGAISRQTLFWNLQQGELVEQGRTLEEEMSDIEAESPSLGMMGAEDGSEGV